MRQARSSRQRYLAYRRRIRQPIDDTTPPPPDADPISRMRHRRDRARPFLQLFVLFLKHVRGDRWTLVVALVMLSIALGAGLAAPYLSKVAIDSAIDGLAYPPWLDGWFAWQANSYAMLTTLAVAIILLHVFRVSVGTIGRWLATKVSQKMRVRMRRRVFGHAVRLPLHDIYERKSGGMTSIIRDDAGAVASLVFAMIYNPWSAIFQIVGILIILAFSDWRMLVGALVLAPAIYFTHRLWIVRIRPMWRDIRATRTHIDSEVTETFSGIRVVRGFSRQRTEAGNFASLSHLMARQEILAWWWSRAVDIIWQLLIPIALAGVLWYVGWRILVDREAIAAGQLVAANALTLGDLFMFLWYLASLLDPMAQLANSATQFQDSLAALDRVEDLLEQEKETPKHKTGKRVEPTTTRGAVQFEQVGFKYPQAPKQAVHDINFEIQAGQTVALVGHSGAGKTTLCNLLARFYEPTQGRVLLDGQDISQFNVESYRQLLAIVEQDIFLFDGTVADNIRYGKRSADLEDVRQAAEQANAAAFIEELNEGYDTWIGERGVKLSGGQRQRIAIARAMLADPKLLILDEATSNLDTYSERLIQKSLETLLQNRTCFVIAHRLSTITHADCIIVMESGRIVEQGKHDELIQRSGVYREMVHMQLQQPGDFAVEES